MAEIVEDKTDASILAEPFRGDDNLHWDAEGGQIIADTINIEELLDKIK